MATNTAGMDRLGSRHGYTYWLNPHDLYVYQQLADGTMNGWIAHVSSWERWAWVMD